MLFRSPVTQRSDHLCFRMLLDSLQFPSDALAIFDRPAFHISEDAKVLTAEISVNDTEFVRRASYSLVTVTMWTNGRGSDAKLRPGTHSGPDEHDHRAPRRYRRLFRLSPLKRASFDLERLCIPLGQIPSRHSFLSEVFGGAGTERSSWVDRTGQCVKSFVSVHSTDVFEPAHAPLLSRREPLGLWAQQLWSTWSRS